jgi:tripartite-type tricarboxylate transporter receptor subunit TctC
MMRWWPIASVSALPYDPDRDFAPIANIVDSAPFAVAVHPDLPAKTIGELMGVASPDPASCPTV